MDGKIGLHSIINKIVFYEWLDKGQLLCGGQLHGKDNFFVSKQPTHRRVAVSFSPYIYGIVGMAIYAN